MIKIDTAKTVANFVVGRSVSFAVAGIIKRYAPAETNLQKAEVLVASYALGSMVAASAETHVDEMIDDLVKAVTDYRSRNNPNQ